jgi:hypothetical protein
MPKVERNMRREMKSLRTQREKIDKRLQMLERAYALLGGAELETATIAASNGSSRPMGKNRKVMGQWPFEILLIRHTKTA